MSTTDNQNTPSISSIETPTDLLNADIYTTETLAYLWDCIDNGENILVSGNVGSKRKETIKALQYFIPDTEKIIFITEQPNNIPERDNLSVYNPSSANTDYVTQLNKSDHMLQPDVIFTTCLLDDEFSHLLNTLTNTTIIATEHADELHQSKHRVESHPININPKVFDIYTHQHYQAEGQVVNMRIGINTPEKLLPIKPVQESLPINIGTNLPTDTESIKRRIEVLDEIQRKNMPNDKEHTAINNTTL